MGTMVPCTWNRCSMCSKLLYTSWQFCYDPRHSRDDRPKVVPIIAISGEHVEILDAAYRLGGLQAAEIIYELLVREQTRGVPDVRPGIADHIDRAIGVHAPLRSRG